jgi:hypothetical protein
VNLPEIAGKPLNILGLAFLAILPLFGTARSNQPVAETPGQPASRPVVPGVAELPKYSVGDSWTVRLDDGSTVTRKVRTVEKDLYVFEWAPDRWKYLDTNLTLKKETTPEGKDWNSYLVNQKLLNFPVSVNKTWEHQLLITRMRDQVRGTRSWWRIFTYKIIESGTIETPAGRFQAFKVEESSHEIECESASNCNSLPNTTIVRHLSYAPEAKFIVKVVRVSGGQWAGQESGYELVAYELK